MHEENLYGSSQINSVGQNAFPEWLNKSLSGGIILLITISALLSLLVSFYANDIQSTPKTVSSNKTNKK